MVQTPVLSLTAETVGGGAGQGTPALKLQPETQSRQTGCCAMVMFWYCKLLVALMMEMLKKADKYHACCQFLCSKGAPMHTLGGYSEIPPGPVCIMAYVSDKHTFFYKTANGMGKKSYA